MRRRRTGHSTWARPTGFAVDSPLEGAVFESSVPERWLRFRDCLDRPFESSIPLTRPPCRAGAESPKAPAFTSESFLSSEFRIYAEKLRTLAVCAPEGVGDRYTFSPRETV